MLAYHLMDYVTAVCPAVRWAISRQMGMKFVENRKREDKNDYGFDGNLAGKEISGTTA